MSRSKASNKGGNPTPFFVVQQSWVSHIDTTLGKLLQPINKPGGEGWNTNVAYLKTVVKEAIEQTQAQVLLGQAGKGIVKADGIGFTTASTHYSTEVALSKNKYSYLVNDLCKEVLDEQNKDVTDSEAYIGPQQVLDAQADANDDSKKDITIKSSNDGEVGSTDIVIDKKTGNATIYEQQEDGTKKKTGFLFRWWKNTKDFAVRIFNWIKNKLVAAWNWLCGLFKRPEDKDVLMASAE